MLQSMIYCAGPHHIMTGSGSVHPHSAAAPSQLSAGNPSGGWSTLSMTGASAACNTAQPPCASSLQPSQTQWDMRMTPTNAGKAVLANAEPPRGGDFDRQFPWSSQLLKLNMWHFKNPSFRGCQEQVLISHCLSVPFS
jgi:hypothetical protein